MDPYEKCPVFEDQDYLLRLVEALDVPDLLLVYSDKRSVPIFNSDNCNGDDFYYTSLERMQSAIEFKEGVMSLFCFETVKCLSQKKAGKGIWRRNDHGKNGERRTDGVMFNIQGQ